jgi:hypothetical protein
MPIISPFEELTIHPKYDENENYKTYITNEVDLKGYNHYHIHKFREDGVEVYFYCLMTK